MLDATEPHPAARTNSSPARREERRNWRIQKTMSNYLLLKDIDIRPKGWNHLHQTKGLNTKPSPDTTGIISFIPENQKTSLWMWNEYSDSTLILDKT